MPLGRNKLYAIVMIACLAGYAWCFYNLMMFQQGKNAVDICMMKLITKIPCPSCGSTRSVLYLMHGDFSQALYINPFGIIIAMIMTVAPVWILIDIILKKSTFRIFFSQIESLLVKPGIAIPLILIVLLNWIWNITKHL